MAILGAPKTFHLSVFDESSAQNAITFVAAEVVHAFASGKKKEV
jgi:hypothetical protein